MDEGLKQRLTSFLDIQEQRMTAYFKYLRTITIISTGLLSLLVGLKPEEIQEGTPQYLFLSTISLLGLGILFSALTQFYEIEYLKQKTKAQKKMIREYAKNRVANKLQIEDLSTPKVFQVSEISTYVCLGLSILTLIAYVFALELKF